MPHGDVRLRRPYVWVLEGEAHDRIHGLTAIDGQLACFCVVPQMKVTQWLCGRAGHGVALTVKLAIVAGTDKAALVTRLDQTAQVGAHCVHRVHPGPVAGDVAARLGYIGRCRLRVVGRPANGENR